MTVRWAPFFIVLMCHSIWLFAEEKPHFMVGADTNLVVYGDSWLSIACLGAGVDLGPIAFQGEIGSNFLHIKKSFILSIDTMLIKNISVYMEKGELSPYFSFDSDSRSTLSVGLTMENIRTRKYPQSELRVRLGFFQYTYKEKTIDTTDNGIIVNIGLWRLF